jgi:hypothetical protein
MLARMTRRILPLTAAAALLLATIRLLAIYMECYSDGPPYYGRTTNMDKWESPAADVAAWCAVGLCAFAVLGRSLVRTRRSRSA